MILGLAFWIWATCSKPKYPPIFYDKKVTLLPINATIVDAGNKEELHQQLKLKGYNTWLEEDQLFQYSFHAPREVDMTFYIHKLGEKYLALGLGDSSGYGYNHYSEALENNRILIYKSTETNKIDNSGWEKHTPPKYGEQASKEVSILQKAWEQKLKPQKKTFEGKRNKKLGIQKKALGLLPKDLDLAGAVVYLPEGNTCCMGVHKNMIQALKEKEVHEIVVGISSEVAHRFNEDVIRDCTPLTEQPVTEEQEDSKEQPATEEQEDAKALDKTPRTRVFFAHTFD